MKSKSAKQLLGALGLPLSAQSFLKGLKLAGLIESRHYESTTGSGELKEFDRLLDTGAGYGMNKESPFHPVKTEVQFYESAFLDAYAAACEALYKDSLARLSESKEGMHK